MSSLSAFFLLTILPLLPIITFLSFLQRGQYDVEVIMGAIYIVFLVRCVPVPYFGCGDAALERGRR